jgi:hypothetical protein
LPPKERGKRIFKSRNTKHETATTSTTGVVDSASHDLTKAADEPVAAVPSPAANDKVEEVEESPPKAVAETTPVDDPVGLSICKISTQPTEADLQVAEALIALPQIRDNRAEATERRTSRRESKRQQLADMAAAAVESQKQRDIEEKVEAAEFLVGLSMSTGTSPITEPVSKQVVEKVAVAELETPTGNKRGQRKRPLKTEERLTPELGRTRAKRNKLDDAMLVDDGLIEEPKDEKKRLDDKPKGRKRADDDDWSPGANASGSKAAKRRLMDPDEAVVGRKDAKLAPITKNHSQKVAADAKGGKKSEEMAVDLEEEIPLPFVIEKTPLVSKVETPPILSPVNTPLKGSSKRKSKREPTAKLQIVEKPQPAPAPKKDDSIFDINSMPIVLSDEPIASDAILIDDDAPSTSKCDPNIIVISPEKPIDAASPKEAIRNSISPTNSKPSLKTIKLKASDTQKIKELQQKSSGKPAVHSPPPIGGVSTTKASLIKSQIILPAVGSPGSPGAIAANAALLARSSISSPSASEDEAQMHMSTKRFPKGKSALVQEEIKLTPATQVVLPMSSPLGKSGGASGSAPMGGQLIITSKGTLITTQSSPVTSMSSYTASGEWWLVKSRRI